MKCNVLLGVLVSGLIFLTGCTAKDVVKNLVEKAYKVTVDSENVVLKASTSEFIVTAKVLDVPLKVVAATLTFIDTKVTDPKVKEAIAKAVKAIEVVNKAVADLTPEKVDKTKQLVIASLEDVKIALRFIGQYVGAKFPPDAEMIATNVDPIKSLVSSSQALTDALNAVKSAK